MLSIDGRIAMRQGRFATFFRIHLKNKWLWYERRGSGSYPLLVLSLVTARLGFAGIVEVSAVTSFAYLTFPRGIGMSCSIRR